MWKNKVRSKKKQFTLIGIMLGVVAMVLSSCMIFFLGLKNYANERFSEKYCPDAYVYSIRRTDVEENFPDEAVNQNIKELMSIEGKNVSVPLRHNGQNISSITSMFCEPSKNGFERYISPLKGSIKDQASPGDGEVWIVSTLASSYDIKLGDTISVQYEPPIELKVTGIYTSTYAPSERLTIMANLVSEGTLASLPTDETAAIFAVNLKDTSEKSLNELSMSNPVALMTMGRASLKQYVTKIQSVVGIVSAVAAFIVFLASMLIIKFIINVDISNELTSIGIYKNLGYSNTSIIGIYMKGYLFIGGISMIIGIFFSSFIAVYLCKMTTKTLGLFRLSLSSWIVGAVIFVILLAILMISLYQALKQIKKVTPIDLLVSGKMNGESKIGRPLFKYAKTPFGTTVNDMFKHKRISILTLLVLTVSFYLLLFFNASFYSCGNIYPNANKWVACPKFNAVISGEVSEDMSAYARELSYVNSAICGNCFFYPAVNLPEYSGNSRNIDYFVFEDTSEEVTKVNIHKGKNPETKNEIAISDMLLKRLKKKIGDDLTMIREGKEVSYHICGSFASMESLTIYMTIDAWREINPDYKPNLSFINLKNEADYQQFKETMESEFSGISVDKEWSALMYAMDAIESMLTKVMLVLMIIFSIFAVIGVINILALTIHNKKRQYGIMSALGFSKKYIISQNLWYITIMVVCSVAIATVLHHLFSKVLFSMIVIDALTNSTALNIGVLGGIIVVIYVIIMYISKTTLNIKPILLMEE